jgi:CheY-like chemotaxis protein
VAAERFDIVLMDVHMPVMNGLDATRQIRARAQGNDRPKVVAVTAAASEEDREACFAAGMDGYLAKPVKPAELLALIEKLSPVAKEAGLNGQRRPSDGSFGGTEKYRRH